MKGMIRFRGTITTQGPVAVSYPGAEQSIPSTPDGRPMLFGNTLRGPLRHLGYKAIRDHLAKAKGIDPKEVFDLADAYMLGIGFDMKNITGNDEGTGIKPLAEVSLRKSNPFLGLFGRWRFRGFAEVSPLIGEPGTQVITYGAGARRDPFEADGTEALFLSDDDMELLSEIKEGDSAINENIKALQQSLKDAKRTIVNLDDKAEKKKLSDKINDLEAQIKALKETKAGGKESVKHPFDGFPALAPHSRLDSRITVASGSEVELGLLLLILRELARSPFIGGHRATGCGEIHFEYQVTLWEADHDAPRVLGKVSGGLDDGFVIEGDELRDALESFKADIQSFDFKMASLKDAGHKQGA